jgi:O-antigen/teichoic acid export membrane protein
MGVVFRQSVKGTIVIAAGALLGALINYAYSFIISETELGYVRTYIVYGAMFHAFIMLGIGNTIINFSPRYPHRDERRKVLVTLGALIPLACLLVASIPYFIFKEELLSLFKSGEDRALAANFFSLVPFFVFLWSYLTTLECFLISQAQIAKLSFVKEVLVRVFNMILIGLLYFKIIDFGGFIYGLTLSYLLAVVILYFISRKVEDFGISFRFRIFNRGDYKEIIKYSWYHMLVSLTLNMLGFIDVLLLGNLAPAGLSSIAVYGHAVFISAIMNIPYRAMSQSAVSTLNRVYLSGDRDELQRIYQRSGINILIAGMAVFLILACNLDNAVAILPENYADVKPLTLILMTGKLVDMSTGLNTELTSVSEYYKFNFRVSVMLLVMLVILCYLFVPTFGAWGAAWGVTTAITLFNIAKMIFLWVKMRIQPFSRQSLMVFAAGALCLIAGSLLPFVVNPVIDALARTAVILICYIAMLTWLKPSADLNTYLQSIRENKRLF